MSDPNIEDAREREVGPDLDFSLEYTDTATSPIAHIDIGGKSIPLYDPSYLSRKSSNSAVRVGLSNGDIGAFALVDPSNADFPGIRFGGLNGNVLAPTNE